MAFLGRIPVGFLRTSDRGSRVAPSRHDACQRSIPKNGSDLAPTLGTCVGRLRLAARCTQRSVDGLLRGDGCHRCRRTWLAGDSHGGLRCPRVAIGRKAEICQSPTLDVAHIHPLVLGSRAPNDRWIGDGRSIRCPLAVPAFDLGELARAAAGSRVTPVTQSAPRTYRDVNSVHLLSHCVVVSINRNQRLKRRYFQT